MPRTTYFYVACGIARLWWMGMLLFEGVSMGCVKELGYVLLLIGIFLGVPLGLSLVRVYMELTPVWAEAFRETVTPNLTGRIPGADGTECQK